jgi:hypothetical protein
MAIKTDLVRPNLSIIPIEDKIDRQPLSRPLEMEEIIQNHL